MGIILKFVLKNIREKKFRTFLIVFSVMLSAALFFASWALTGTFEAMLVNRIRQYFGSTDIVIQTNQKSRSPYINSVLLEPWMNRFKYVAGAVEGDGKYKQGHETMNFRVEGFDYRELQRMNPFKLLKTRALFPFDGNKIILGESIAKKFQLSIGQTVEMEIYGTKHKLKLVGIAKSTGLFLDDGWTNIAVVPKLTLGSYINARGRNFILYVALKDPKETQSMIKILSGVYKHDTVREPFSAEEFKQQVQKTTTSFLIMLTMVLMMSVFIIYTSFKVITRERLPVIGTFRSVGATKFSTDLMLFAESVTYGVIGGFLGCWLGIGILYVMTMMMKESWMELTLKFNMLQLVVSFLVAVLLSLISSALPILKVSRLPVKEIVLNIMEGTKKQKLWKLPLGILMVIAALAIPNYATNKDFAVLIHVGCLIMISSALIMLVPFVCLGFTRLMEGLFNRLFGNIGALAVKNIRKNKSVYNNIALISIGISSLLMINVISENAAKATLDVWRDAKFQIWMAVWPADRNTKRSIMTVNGVLDAYPRFPTQTVELPDYHIKLQALGGVDPVNYLRFWNINTRENPWKVLRELDKGRNIILTYTMKEKLKVNRGDILTMQLKRGLKSYRIIGFFESTWENGSYALIPQRYFKMDMLQFTTSDYWVKTSEDPVAVAAKLKEKFQRNWPWVDTIQAMTDRNMQGNAQMFYILKGFSFLAMIIGIFGVLNNLLISFIERKRSFAMMRSVGMDRRQMLTMILLEAFTGGLIGGLIGIVGGLLTISIVPQLLMALDYPNIAMHCSWILLLYSMIGSIIISVVASIGPAVKSTRLNLLESLKYE